MMRLLCHKNLATAYCCTGVFLILLFDSIFDHKKTISFLKEGKKASRIMLKVNLYSIYPYDRRISIKIIKFMLSLENMQEK